MSKRPNKTKNKQINEHSHNESLFKEEDEFEVEKVIAKKTKNGKLYYLIKWEGYSSAENTWEPIENLTNIGELIKDFELEEEEKLSLKKSKIKKIEESDLEERYADYGLGNPNKKVRKINNIKAPDDSKAKAQTEGKIISVEKSKLKKF
jgi:hypothetical protein